MELTYQEILETLRIVIDDELDNQDFVAEHGTAERWKEETEYLKGRKNLVKEEIKAFTLSNYNRDDLETLEKIHRITRIRNAEIRAIDEFINGRCLGRRKKPVVDSDEVGGER